MDNFIWMKTNIIININQRYKCVIVFVAINIENK